MEEMNALPMWVNVFIGIVAALGGWEAIKYLLSLRANRVPPIETVDAYDFTVGYPEKLSF